MLNNKKIVDYIQKIIILSIERLINNAEAESSKSRKPRQRGKAMTNKTKGLLYIFFGAGLALTAVAVLAVITAIA